MPSLEENISKLKKLYKIQFPTKRELMEIAMLEDDVKLMIEDSKQTEQVRLLREGIEKEQKPKKQYRGIISGRIEKWRDERRERNRATPDKIKQLKLDAEQEELKARISIAKKKQKDNKTSKFDFHIPGKIFTEEDNKQYNKSKKAISDDKKDYSVLGF